MRGYKALNEDMSTIHGDMTYELNKEYSIYGKLKMCNNGYHFCNKLIDVYNYYSSNSRIFEIDTLNGIVIKDNEYDKYCSSKIKLIREISEKEINKYIEDNLYKLINDESWYVREAVANQGYGLDILINDEDWKIRSAIAEQKYGLDILINDEKSIVRAEVAKQGYGLDILINDESWYVREAVAKQGYGLDKLINDPNPYVRERARNIKQLYENKEDK